MKYLSSLLVLALLSCLLLPSCRGLRQQRDAAPREVAYVSLTVENATHWQGAKRFAAAGERAQSVPVAYHMLMKDDTWYLEESSVRPAAGLFYYNDYGSIGAAQAQAVLEAARGVVTRNRGRNEPSATPGSSSRKLFTLAVNSQDGGKGKVRYYESNKVKARDFRRLLQAMRAAARSEGTVLPLSTRLADVDSGK